VYRLVWLALSSEAIIRGAARAIGALIPAGIPAEGPLPPVSAAFPAAATPVFAMGEAGEITGLSGLRQGLGLDIVPYAKLRLSRDNETGHERVELKPGLDVFYKLTPSVTVALTLNTDFAEAEGR